MAKHYVGVFVPSRKHLLSTLRALRVMPDGSLVHDGRLRLARPRSRGSKLRQLAADCRGHRRSCHVESPVVLCSGSVFCSVRFILVVLLLRELLPSRHHLGNLTRGGVEPRVERQKVHFGAREGLVCSLCGSTETLVDVAARPSRRPAPFALQSQRGAGSTHGVRTRNERVGARPHSVLLTCSLRWLLSICFMPGGATKYLQQMFRPRGENPGDCEHLVGPHRHSL